MTLLNLFALVCWFVACTAMWALLHPDVPTQGFLRTSGLAIVAVSCVVLSGWGNGSGGIGALLLVGALALLSVDYWSRKYASANPNA